MYNKFNSKRKFFAGNRNNNRRVKSFDPTNVINNNNLNKVVQNIDTYQAKYNFSDFDIDSKLKSNISYRNYKTPTPIQDQAIPEIIQGKDIIGIANTGTGKTLAFLIPLINKVIRKRDEYVLIMAPTRELAKQIQDDLYSISRGLNVYSALLIGGENINRQKHALYKKPNFVIATPGRLLDHQSTKTIDLQKFGTVVLDEADHMVDIGFLKDIKKIISLLKRDRQSLFFSATIENSVKDVLNQFVNNNPITISVKSRDTASNVTQQTIKIGHQGQKINKLMELLSDKDFDKTLVFVRTKHGAQKLSNALRDKGFKSDCIHGNKRQSQRIRTLENFKQNKIKILVATGVASRGLDIPNVSHVINYDQPEDYQTYIHRIGRTGRADKKGVAITFT